MKTLLIMFVLGAAPIAAENRVENTPSTMPGTCWFACAEMIGKQCDVVGLRGLQSEVINERGADYLYGASPDGIARRLAERRVIYAHCLLRDPLFISRHLEAGRPVLCNVRVQRSAHSIVVTDVHPAWDGRAWSWWVCYVDPNAVDRDVVVSWEFFWSLWSGEAYAFEPS